MSCPSAITLTREDSPIFTTPRRARITLACLAITAFGLIIAQSQGQLRATKAVWLAYSGIGILICFEVPFIISRPPQRQRAAINHIPQERQETNAFSAKPWKIYRFNKNVDMKRFNHKEVFLISINKGLPNHEYLSVNQSLITGKQVKDLKEMLEIYLQSPWGINAIIKDCTLDDDRILDDCISQRDLCILEVVFKQPPIPLEQSIQRRSLYDGRDLL